MKVKRKISDINIIKTLIELYERQENINISAKIIDKNNNISYLYDNEKIIKQR